PGVDPVDVPVLFQREDEADLESAARSDAGGERREFRCEMLRFNRAGAAVADDLKLGVCGRMKEEGAGDEQQRAKAANDHQCQLYGFVVRGFVTLMSCCGARS